MSPKGFGGVELPPMRARQRSHSEGEDTPPSDNIRDLIRRDEDARKEQLHRIERFAGVAKAAEQKADDADQKSERAEQLASEAKQITGGFNWKLTAILSLVGATWLTVVGGVVWQYQRADAIEERAISKSRDAARGEALEALRTMKNDLREEVKVDRIESIRELRRQERAEVDTLVARAPQ